MARTTKPKKEISMEEALWKSAAVCRITLNFKRDLGL